MEQMAYVLDRPGGMKVSSVQPTNFDSAMCCFGRLIRFLLQIGFSVLAAVPETGNVYPLLGRAHDSLLPQREEDP